MTVASKLTITGSTVSCYSGVAYTIGLGLSHTRTVHALRTVGWTRSEPVSDG